MSFSYCRSGTKDALRRDLIAESQKSSVDVASIAAILPVLQSEPNETSAFELDCGGHNGKLYKLSLRGIGAIVSSLVLLASLPFSARAQGPTPDQWQQAQALLAIAGSDAAACTAQAAIVTTDSGNVTSAQNVLAQVQQQLVADQAVAATDATQFQTDLATAIAYLQSLQTSTSAAKAVRASSDDQADMAEAVARGFGSRLAVGPYRDVTMAIRQWRGGLTGPSDPDALTKLQAILGRTPRFTACQKATIAVIALELTNSFSPGTIPPQVLALAIQLQAAACGTPIPTLAPVPDKIPPLPKKHATGLIQLPLKTRQALHVKDALTHRDFHAKHGTVVLPASLDLRAVCPPVEDQNGDGTCHDHSGVDTACCSNIKVGNLTASQPLSVQYIVDLNPNNDGTCSGGDASTIFQWLKQGNGIPTVQAYGPETNACNQGCQLSTTAAGYTISDWGYADTVTGVASVQAMQESLVTYGVTSVCIGCPDSFMNYAGGIYNGDLSSGIDHQVSIVGYTIDATVPGGGYWILRNSWGTGWGENGYARISFASNPTTEAMWNVASKGQTTVVQPWGSPQPTPTRGLGSLLSEVEPMIARYQGGTPAEQMEVMSLLRRVQDDVKQTKAKLRRLSQAPITQSM